MRLLSANSNCNSLSGLTLRTGGSHRLDACRNQHLGRRIESSAGYLSVTFDAQGRLLSIFIEASNGEESIFVGDRNGKRMIPLPASRDELVELFGEPESERDMPSGRNW